MSLVFSILVMSKTITAPISLYTTLTIDEHALTLSVPSYQLPLELRPTLLTIPVLLSQIDLTVNVVEISLHDILTQIV